jgi:NADPH-dependent 2,4-dienoyl-CoA reductase/sulfur reductase-like enzyme/nitrite reductase/ring-hydroxylating ferredoxin subunit
MENGMSEDKSGESSPDLTQGVPIESLADSGMLAGHVGENQVMLARVGSDFFAIDAACTHYHAPLASGLLVGDTVRCPWHHACFSLRTGEAVRAPALSPVACWSTSVRDGKVFVDKKRSPSVNSALAPPSQIRNIAIVGAGAAGIAAAGRLRRLGYEGNLTMLSDEETPPVDRPNLSKDYLSGSAPEAWLPLREATFYTDNRIDLRLNAHVSRIYPDTRQLLLADGSTMAYDRLLMATGAEAVRLPIPGMDLPHVLTLRTLADCRAIVARAASAQHVVVIGASFIGMEVAASLRTRGVDVHVVAPGRRPMERILGPDLGDFIRKLHEDHGVVFHLEKTVSAIGAQQIRLKEGGHIQADLVIVGAGARPRLALAEQAGLAIDRGVVVDSYLRTSVPEIFAAGDIVRWPDPHSGKCIRVEHWVVAQRQGQTAAMNLLGGEEKFDAVPFFWSQHYDVPINYVGHAEGFDNVSIEGSIPDRDCVLRYKQNGVVVAVASIFRDIDSLRAEVEMESRRP